MFFPVARPLRFLIGLAVLIMAALSGCASTVAPRYSLTYRDEAAYEASLAAVTREAKLYDKLDTRLLVKATLITDAFRRAYYEEYLRVFQLSPRAKGELDTIYAHEIEENLEAMVWVASAEDRNANLLAHDPIWRIELFNQQGRSIQPVEIDRIKKPTAMDLHFYPYLGGIGRSYRIEFPRQFEDGQPFYNGGPMVMRFSGVLGVAELTFELAKDAVMVRGSVAE